MLAGILKSELAIKMSLRIVDTFITMRRYINTNLIEQRTTNKLVLEYDKRISKPFKKIHIFIREVYLPWRIGGVNMPKS